ncbi:asparagine synthase (glutamine-hydrolyzing) [Cylindrospermopsis raciborskii DSH]|uniref:asparagine synthase (glutamine-hydrolyzing) n=1 Tax=Cylindrospermopsis raciborskii TaxID=77022 RepID=UPI002ED7D42E
MCGLTGFFHPGGFHLEESTSMVQEMANTLVHRGPDDSGQWLDDNLGIAMAHRRLSILDLSPAGHQPMISTSGRYVLIFNGEIYNHLEIRHQIESSGWTQGWRGHSDTETLLAAIEQWGLKTTLQKSVGMFALALWDRREQVLSLARDRMGEKPLYYGWQGKTFLFTSELKALRHHPDFKGDINRDVLPLFFRHNYIPTPYSIYRDIWKLSPGTLMQITSHVGQIPQPQPYWSLQEVAELGQTAPFSGSDSEAISLLQQHLMSAVGQQTIADVPLGAFLSGGIDSSTVVALMQAQSSRPIRTFTIGFHETGYNEAVYAKSIAKHLGTDHTELYVTKDQVREVIPHLPTLYDEPFSDSSQIPTYLVSQLARHHVTVSLSGDGGDELFGGYGRYSTARKWWERSQSIPGPMRSLLGKGLQIFTSSKYLPAYLDGRVHCRLQKLGELLTANPPELIYRQFVSHWKNEDQLVIAALEPPSFLDTPNFWPKLPNFDSWMMFADTVTYLPDDILVKVDRAAMGVSLETRVPLLDHRVVEFAWQLPLSLKVRQGQGKWLLRQLLYQYIPRELIDRPKMGFGVPINTWLGSSLRDWAESLLGEDILRQQGFLNPTSVRKKWQEHLSGERDWQYLLWDVLMFQAWLEVQ